MANDSGSSDFLAGFVVGSLVGIALGMLFSPRPGEETRAFLAEKSDRLRTRVGVSEVPYPKGLGDLSEQARVQSEELREVGLAAIERQIAVAQEAIDASKAQLRELVEQQRARLREAIEEGKEAATKTREELLGKLERGEQESG